MVTVTVTVYVYNGPEEDDAINSYEIDNIKIYQDIVTALIHYKVRSGRVVLLDGNELLDYNSKVKHGSMVKYIMVKGDEHYDFFELKNLNILTSMGKKLGEFTARVPFRDELIDQMTFRDIYNYAVAAGAPINSIAILGFMKNTGEKVPLDTPLAREPLYSQGITIVIPE